jgi:hypothetical protein
VVDEPKDLNDAPPTPAVARATCVKNFLQFMISSHYLLLFPLKMDIFQPVLTGVVFKGRRISDRCDKNGHGKRIIQSNQESSDIPVRHNNMK